MDEEVDAIDEGDRAGNVDDVDAVGADNNEDKDGVVVNDDDDDPCKALNGRRGGSDVSLAGLIGKGSDDDEDDKEVGYGLDRRSDVIEGDDCGDCDGDTDWNNGLLLLLLLLSVNDPFLDDAVLACT